MIVEGNIVKGPFWSEPIEIKKIERFGRNTQIIGATIYSNQLYERLLDEEDINKLVVDDIIIDFSEPASEVFLSLEAQRYKFASMFDPFLAMSAAKIDPLPFQLDAVYLKALKQPRMRFMIADDPGAGKTIMAGLIIKELKLRGLVRRILIVSPGHLKQQWKRELKEKFEEKFQIVDRSYIKNHSDDNPWNFENQYITSIDFAKQEDIRNMLSAVEWDLVVVDEAHKMSAYKYGKNISKTLNYKLGEVLSKTSENLLFLTATPHKGNPENYRLLLDLLIPGFFADPAMVNEARRNGDNPLFIRRIKEDLKDFDGKPIFTKRFTTTVKFDLNKEEIELYNDLSDYVRTQFNKALRNNKTKNNFTFALVLLQRRMASSIYSLLMSLERKKAKFEEMINDPHILEEIKNIDVVDREDSSETERWKQETQWESTSLSDDINELENEILIIEKLIRKADSILIFNDETKLSKLKEIMESLGEEKILIFSESKDTVNYLIEKVSSWDYSVNTIHGSMSMEQRIDAESIFRDRTQVMIATEAAGEGINLQFCHFMINYDIPWNPNRLEQRMGRIHRYKQDKNVHIFNFVAENTREGLVLATVLDKLNEIRNAIGTDKVFDVIGDVFKGKDLYNLIVEAVSGKRSEYEIQKDLDIEIDGEYKEKLRKELLDQGLVDNIDYKSIMEMKKESIDNKLNPDNIEKFFKDAFSKAEGKFDTRKDGSIYVRTIPREIKNIAKEKNFERKYGKISIPTKITFYKENSKDNNEIEYVSFGHPLLESLIKWIEYKYSSKMKRGSCFIDPSGIYNGIIWFFEGSIKDGKDDIVGRKLFSVYDDGNKMENINPSILWDLEPSKNQIPLDKDLNMKNAKIQAINSIKEYLEELKRDRERQADIKEKYGIKSLEKLLAGIKSDLSILFLKLAVGDDVDLAIYNKEVKKEDYKAAIKILSEEILKEKSLTLSMPKFVGAIQVKSS